MDIMKTMLDACKTMYLETEEDKWLEAAHKLGWEYDPKSGEAFKD